MNQQFAALQAWIKANPKKAVLLGAGAGVLAWWGAKNLGAGSPRAEYVPGEVTEDAAGISLGEDPIEPLPLAFDQYYPTGLLPSYDYRPGGNGGPQPSPSGYQPSYYELPFQSPTEAARSPRTFLQQQESRISSYMEALGVSSPGGVQSALSARMAESGSGFAFAGPAAPGYTGPSWEPASSYTRKPPIRLKSTTSVTPRTSPQTAGSGGAGTARII